MPEMDSIFHSSVQEAVQLTIQNYKPLFVFLASPDNSTNEAFLSKFIKDHTVSHLQQYSIPLKLTQGSVEFGYFEQLFQNLIVPSFYIVQHGKLKAVITNDFTPDDFDKCVAQFSTDHSESSTYVSATPSNPPTASSSQAPEVSHTTTGDNPTTPAPTATTSNDKEPPTSSENIAKAQKPPASQSTTTDEHEQTVLMHKQLVAQQRKEKMAEKKRIRELLEADKRERQSRERAEKERVADINPPSQNLSRKAPHTNCLLAIKLFDGSTIKHGFKPEDTLVTVRTFLDDEIEIIPSTSNMPSFASTTYPTGYLFHRPTLPRVTYSEEQELHSLVELDLTPRSILILKPTYDQTTASNKSPGNEKVGIFRSVYNTVGGIGRALYSFFDYGVEDIQRQANTEQTTAPHQEEEVIDLHQPIAPGLLSVGDRGLSSSLINIERDERDVIVATPVESRASSPRPALSRVQTIHDDVRDTLRDTYNGNSINLRDDDQNI
ncbi:hypothetical protein CANMA_005034 [Candida margitis]|uniref:uncharacterized protein n=1 Tax=Candida margitis TaxID=1775924 RepID=UPI002226B9A8|nr:uncharacterized protein CANMA_005034 [Candida margitis]KAI5953009.1 hypothetical protein CANMA_005034 [Candida margitis]